MRLVVGCLGVVGGEKWLKGIFIDSKEDVLNIVSKVRRWIEWLLSDNIVRKYNYRIVK